MTDFVAVYFMLWLAAGATVAGLVWRYWIFYIASALCWFVVAIYSLIVSHANLIYVWAFALFCFAMAFAMIFAYYWIPRMIRKRNEYTPFTTYEDWETPEGRKQYQQMWGEKSNPKKMSEEDIKQKRRAKGEWVNNGD